MRSLLFAAVLAAVVPGMQTQSEPFLGKWELNLSASAITRGAPPQRESIVNVAEAGGFQSTLTTETTRGTNVEIHHYVFDGAFHQSEGADPRELSFRRVETPTIDSDTRRNGTVTVHRRLVVSADGRTLTVTASGTSGGGQAYTNDRRVYDRQSGR